MSHLKRSITFKRQDCKKYCILKFKKLHGSNLSSNSGCIVYNSVESVMFLHGSVFQSFTNGFGNPQLLVK